jgi:hypothetical protein
MAASSRVARIMTVQMESSHQSSEQRESDNVQMHRGERGKRQEARGKTAGTIISGAVPCRRCGYSADSRQLPSHGQALATMKAGKKGGKLCTKVSDLQNPRPTQ